MLIAKESLAGLLLEDGEESLAVLLAHSELPPEIDTDAHAEQLRELGLDTDVLHPLLPSVQPATESVAGSRSGSNARQTVSQRWADLVADWTGTR